MTYKLSCTALVLCAAAFAVPALAGSPVSNFDPSQPSVAIRYSEADLATPAGARALASRIKDAAILVCGGDSVVDRQAVGYDDCREAAIDAALSSVKAPMVAEALGRHGLTSLAAR
jgi:UrcA family protein